MYKKIILLSICTVFLLFTGCTKESESKEENTQKEEMEALDVEEIPAEEETGEKAEVTDICVDTPYGELHFSEEWYDYLKTEVVEEASTYSVTFSADIAGNVFSLFAITYGESEGDLLGTAADMSGNTVPVYLNIYELQNMDTLDSGQKDIVYAMSESVNYVLEMMRQSEDFTPNS